MYVLENNVSIHQNQYYTLSNNTYICVCSICIYVYMHYTYLCHHYNIGVSLYYVTIASL